MSDRMYLISEDKDHYVELSKNEWIITLPKDEYYISDWRSLKGGFDSAATVPGFCGEELFKWLHEHGYWHMTKEERVFYELAK